MARFRGWLEQEKGRRFASYHDLWAWSSSDLDGFWQSIWDYHGLHSPTQPSGVLTRDAMPGSQWFPGAQLNYARQVFRHKVAADEAGQPAIVAEDERAVVSTLTWHELERRMASLAIELRGLGVTRGDRVAAYLPNRAEAVVAFLACASIGAIWSVCSPDMGTPAILDRFQQIAPRALIVADGVHYGGRAIDCSAEVRRIRDGLHDLVGVIVLHAEHAPEPPADWIDFQAATARTGPDVADFEPDWLPFDHPLWILYSSGTTGLPKAIVQGHGGIILAALAGAMHLDLGASYEPATFGERFLWYSSTGWVMWNAQVNALLGGTTICLFDGSPTGSKSSPSWSTLWTFAARHRVTWFGAGAAFYIGCRKAGLDLRTCGDLSNLRALGSTGSPLPADVQWWGSEQFERLGTPDIWWCNVSGGTDLCANFAAGNRDLPPTPGRLQCRQLGAAVAAWDDDGRPVIGAVGELVCTRPFPSMPLYFWGDRDSERYRSSYFDVWPGVWRHGDWLQIDADGGCTLSGRSDATINRHGHRMGTADLYSAVEGIAGVLDSLVIDLEDGQGGSELLMFVVPTGGEKLAASLISTMKETIRTALSPRFVPDHFIAAPGIPRTLSGKKQEVPVKRLFGGLASDIAFNRNVMANPGVVGWYEDQAEAWRAVRERRDVRCAASERPT